MSNPQAYVSVRKSRLRTEANNTVYLEKDMEFEIELYNPTTDRIGALITINGKKLSSSFIVRPGETVHVERYLDVAKKFKFETYMVDGSTETKNAIRDNGGIKVEFYRERVSQPVQNQPVLINQIPVIYEPYYRPQYYYSNSGTADHNALRSFTTSDASILNSNVSSGTTTNFTMNYSGDIEEPKMDLRRSIDNNDGKKKFFKKSSIGGSSASASLNFAEVPQQVETGRVEQGSYSNQKFKNVLITLEHYPFHTVHIKVLPVSQRPEEATVYCSGCGRRGRDKENFCPKCGRSLKS